MRVDPEPFSSLPRGLTLAMEGPTSLSVGRGFRVSTLHVGVLEWACSLAAVWGRRVFSPFGYVF